MVDMTFCKTMINETFCFFAKHLHVGMFWFDVFLWMYWESEISNVFKKRDHDYTLYTSKEIDWFEIKDNIKI